MRLLLFCALFASSLAFGQTVDCSHGPQFALYGSYPYSVSEGGPFSSVDLACQADVGGAWSAQVYGHFCLETNGSDFSAAPVYDLCSSVQAQVVADSGLGSGAGLSLTADKVADYMSLWELWLAAGVFVLIAKSLYNRFRVDHD